MPQTVITTLEQVTPEWLTTVLTQNGAITRGRLLSVDAESGGGNWSSNARLALSYSEDARGESPTRLFLKMCRSDPDSKDAFDDSEVNYYTRDYLDVPDAPLVRCYHAGYSKEPRHYHLLLEDVSDTHFPAYEKERELASGLAMVEGLATLHTRWWGPQRLAEAGASIHTSAEIQHFVNMGWPGVAPILSHYSDQFEPHWPDLIKETFARHSQAAIARTLQATDQTIIHGDANPTNILIPRRGNRPIYIIDRQPFRWGLTTWLGVFDLVYITVFDLNPEQRRQFERPLLQRYYETLLRLGVTGYSLAQFHQDYRLAVPLGIYIFTEYCADGIDKELEFVWLTVLKRTLTAMDEWDCAGMW